MDRVLSKFHTGSAQYAIQVNVLTQASINSRNHTQGVVVLPIYLLTWRVTLTKSLLAGNSNVVSLLKTGKKYYNNGTSELLESITNRNWNFVQNAH